MTRVVNIRRDAAEVKRATAAGEYVYSLLYHEQIVQLMTSLAIHGAIVSIYVDLSATVTPGDVIETQTGRRYSVVTVRVQARGKHEGRQHLRCAVMATRDQVPCRGTVRTQPHNIACLMCGARGQTCERTLHTIRWYARGKR